MNGFVPKIGIMQGRLSEPIDNKIQSFPYLTWDKEFEKAHNCGFQVMEWIFDDIDNPLMNDSQITKIKFLSEKFNVKINSVCADFFMEEKLFTITESKLEKNIRILENLIDQCSKAGIKILEIPLVDSSSLANKNNQYEFVHNLKKVIPQAVESDVTITLETDLAPNDFKALLEQFKILNITANYDTGNSASLGYDVEKELNLLGPWLKNIHIKDRVYKGKSVPLGEGDANFDLFFSNLAKIQYHGDLIIQGARELPNSKLNSEEVCKIYYQFVKQYVDKYLKRIKENV